MLTPIWKHDPDGHDYPAAEGFLRLLVSERDARRLVHDLRHAAAVEHPAKDILRAADDDRLPYPRSNEHTARQLERIRAGEKLSPVLLVVDTGTRVTWIADGSHRVSAAWWCGEDTPVPCRIAYHTRGD